MKLGEFQLIDKLKKQFFHESLTETGIGDDCAVIPLSKTEKYLVTTDALVENVHFKIENQSYENLGWKSIAVSFSDIAAMGGSPEYVFISLAIPNHVTSKDIQLYYDGVQTICDQYQVRLLGGDTTGSLSGLYISVTVIGLAKNNTILYRNGAKQGDYIYVTGYLGDSSLGLSLLLGGNLFGCNEKKLIQKHLLPQPRVKAINFLQKDYKITSAIDISDGLSSDLSHIIRASNVGALLYWDNFPLSDELKIILADKESEKYILHGGEEYEILFTSPDTIDIAQFQETTNTKLSKLGVITAGNSIKLKSGTSIIPISPKGFDHFFKNKS